MRKYDATAVARHTAFQNMLDVKNLKLRFSEILECAGKHLR